MGNPPAGQKREISVGVDNIRNRHINLIALFVVSKCVHALLYVCVCVFRVGGG